MKQALMRAIDILKIDNTIIKAVADDSAANKQVLFIVLLSALVSGVVIKTVGGASWGGMLAGILAGFLISIVGLLIWVGVIKLMVTLLSGEIKFMQLFRTFGLAMLLSAISSALGFIVVVGTIVSVVILLYWLFVNVMIVKELSRLSYGRAVAAVLIPVAVFVVLVVALASKLGILPLFV